MVPSIYFFLDKKAQVNAEFLIWKHMSASHPKTIHATQGATTTIFTE